MDQIQYDRIIRQITNGQATPAAQKNSEPKPKIATAFQTLLEKQLQSGRDIVFSKHAASRVAQRNIELSESHLSRLNEGFRLAEQKGLQEPLILIDKTAFIVSVKNNTVVTTVQEDDLKGSVFTNIDGTVII
jgi:flagellar operon protein